MPDGDSQTVQFKSPTTGAVKPLRSEDWDEALSRGYKPVDHTVMYSPDGKRGFVPNAELRNYMSKGYQTTPQTQFEKDNPVPSLDEREANEFLLGAASGASGLPESTHPLTDFGKSLFAPPKVNADTVGESILGPAYGIGKSICGWLQTRSLSDGIDVSGARVYGFCAASSTAGDSQSEGAAQHSSPGQVGPIDTVSLEGEGSSSSASPNFQGELPPAPTEPTKPFPTVKPKPRPSTLSAPEGVQGSVAKPSGRLVLTPEEIQAEDRMQAIAKDRASKHGMYYAGGMRPPGGGRDVY